jgi:predicted TIM-barrel fold metal-dependent hydrolase
MAVPRTHRDAPGAAPASCACAILSAHPENRNRAMLDILDPTIATARERIAYAPRPQRFDGLRVGLIDNTRKNSEAVLRRLAEKLAADHGITMEVMVHKHQRAPLKDEQIAELKGRTDFVIAGVGD